MGKSLAIALGLIICAGSGPNLAAQGTNSRTPAAAKPEPTAPKDPFGRETPRSTVMGLLKASARGDHDAAANYFQTPKGRTAEAAEYAKHFRELREYFEGSVAQLSNDPEGNLEPGLPPGEVRAGTFRVGDSSADVILVRVDDAAAGKIWLISRGTVENVEKLVGTARRAQPPLLIRILPAKLTQTEFLGMSWAAWLGWLLSVPIAFLLSWPVAFLLSLPRRLVCRIRGIPFRAVWETRIGKPLRYILAILINSFSVYLLRPPLLYRVYYLRLMAALLAAAIIYLFAILSDQTFERALGRARKYGTGTESILLLTQRFIRVVLFLAAVLVALAVAGLNVTTALAGLGIGGLAIAFAAQKTLENVLGGLTLLMDKGVQVGNFCRIGNQLGTVEDIGLRSIKLRTLDQTMLMVPNSAMAQMQFENFASRRKCLLNQQFSLRIETEVEQLRCVLDRVQRMLDEHPAIERGTSRIRVANVAGAAFELELWAYGKTSDWAEFTAIRHDVILNIAEIVATSGTKFAAPTQLTYVARDPGIDGQQAGNRAERRFTERM